MTLGLFGGLVFDLGRVLQGTNTNISILRINIWEVIQGNAGRDVGKKTGRGER